MSFAWLGKKARVEDEPQDDAGSGEASTATSSSSSAAAFVQQQRQQGTKRSGSDDTEPAREFSVHITHVPFTATQADLDEFFKGHDCVVDDIRMVRKVSAGRVAVQSIATYLSCSCASFLFCVMPSLSLALCFCLCELNAPLHVPCLWCLTGVVAALCAWLWRCFM